MKRPIVIVSIGYILGILWGICFEKSISFFVVVVLLISIKVLSKKYHIDKSVKILCFIILLTSVISSYQVHYIRQQDNNIYNLNEELKEWAGIITSERNR